MNAAIVVLCLLGCMAACPANAQINKGKKLVEQREYEAALEAFENDLERPTNQPIALAEMARVYADSRYSGKDLTKAYQFATNALRAFDQLSSSDKKKVQNKGEDQLSISKLQKDLLRRSYQQALDANELEQYNAFLQDFHTASTQQQAAITQKRNQIAYDLAETKGTYADFKQLWDDHQASLELHSAKLYSRLQKRLLQSYVAEKGWSLYPQFETLYPNNLYVRDGDKAYEFINAKNKHTFKAYQNFIQAYPRSPFVAFAQDGLYELTMASEQLEQYDAFVRSHEDYEGIEPLWKQFYQLYRQQRGEGSIKTFAQAYPNYPFQEQLNQDLKQAQAKLQKPLYERITATEDVLLMVDFAKRYPQSPYISKLELPLYSALGKNPLLEGTRFFLKQYPRSIHYDNVLALYYDALVQDGELSTLNQFMMEHPEYKDIQQQQSDLEVAEKGAQLMLRHPMPAGAEAAYEAYIKAAAPKERAWVALQRLIAADVHAQDYPTALATVRRLAPHFGEQDARIQHLLELLQEQTMPSEGSPSLQTMLDQPEAVLCDLSLDGNRLMFSTHHTDGTIKLWESIRQQGQWSPVQPYSSLQAITPNDAQLADISVDEHLTLWEITNEQRQELWFAPKQGTNWLAPHYLPPFGQTKGSVADGQLAAGAHALLFASNAPEGLLHAPVAASVQDFHGNENGNWDLFVLVRQEGGYWSRPINLGPVINTPYEERHPLLHADGKTLYFSSDGHGGLGRLDIYRCTRLDDTWMHWSEPEHLGTLFNGSGDDYPQGITADGQRLYWSRRSAGLERRSFETNLSKSFQSQATTLVNIQLQNIQGTPLAATLVWKEQGQKGVPYSYQTASGSAQVAVLPHQTYTYWLEKPNYWSPAVYTSPEKAVHQQLILTAYSASELLQQPVQLLPAGLSSVEQEAEISRLVKWVQKEDLTILFPKYDQAEKGLPDTETIEALLRQLECPKKYFSWYTPTDTQNTNTGLLVRFRPLSASSN